MKTTGKMVPYLIRMMLQKTHTAHYPTIPAEVPATYRGALKFDRELCVGCRLCERVCPAGSGAIKIEKIADKQFKAIVHLDKCIFCGRCVDACARKALQSTRHFELASPDKDTLRVEL